MKLEESENEGLQWWLEVEDEDLWLSEGKRERFE